MRRAGGIRICGRGAARRSSTRTTFDWQHYAFKVSDGEFDEIFQRVRDEGLGYGSGPFSPDDMTINHRGGGRGFYFKDPNGHLLEVLTI